MLIIRSRERLTAKSGINRFLTYDGIVQLIRSDCLAYNRIGALYSYYITSFLKMSSTFLGGSYGFARIERNVTVCYNEGVM